MANIKFKKGIKTNNKYVNVETLMETTLTRGTEYCIQPTGCCTFFVGSTLPEEGGNTVYNNEQCFFTLESSDNLYVNSYTNTIQLNISK